MVDLADLLRGVSALSVAAALLVVAGVGVLAVYAEFVDTWVWFFRMERIASMAVPVVLGLLGVALSSGIGVVYRSE